MADRIEQLVAELGDANDRCDDLTGKLGDANDEIVRLRSGYAFRGELVEELRGREVALWAKVEQLREENAHYRRAAGQPSVRGGDA